MASSQLIRTSKNAIMLMLGNVTRMVATFGFVLYSASRLGLEGFGKYSLTINLFELFLGLGASAAGILLTRDIARWPRRLNVLLSGAIVQVTVLAAIAPVFMLLTGYLLGCASDTISALMIVSIALLPAVICMLLEAVFVAKEKAEIVTLGTAIESLARVVLGVLALANGFGLLELAAIIVVTRSVQLLGYLFLARSFYSVRWQFDWQSTRRFTSRWRIFAAENWLATIYLNLDVLILSAVAGESAVGLYSAAGKFVRLGSVISRSFTAAVFPVMSRMFVESPASFQQFYSRTIRVMYTVAFPIVIGVTVLSDRIVAMLYSDEFSDTAPVLRVLIWLVLLDFVNPFLSHVLIAQGRQHRSMYVAAISLCVNATVCSLLVWKLGAIGAALGSVLGGFVAMACYLAFAVSRAEALVTLTSAFRVMLAALGMGTVVFVLRDELMIALAFGSLLAYVALLFLVKAIRGEDVRYFKTMILSKAIS